MSRRRHYRVDTRDLPVVMRLVVAGRPPLPIRVDDLSIRGALVRLPSEEEPLAVGSVVRIEVFGGRGRALEVAARVVRCHDPDLRAYGLMFLEPAAIEGRLTPELARIFNRRRVPRVVTDGLQVVIGVPGARWAVDVRDVSCDAAGLAAEEPAEPLQDGDAVTVRLHVPGDRDALRLEGVLRVRSEAAGRSRVVVVFDRSEVNDAPRLRLQAFTEHTRDRG